MAHTSTSSSSSAPDSAPALMPVPQDTVRETSEQRAYKALLLGSSFSSSAAHDDMPALYTLPPSPSSSSASEDEEEYRRYIQRERAFVEAASYFAPLWEGLKAQHVAAKRTPFASRRVPRRERRQLHTSSSTTTIIAIPAANTTTDNEPHPPRRVHYRLEITSMAHMDSYPTPWS